MKSHVTFAFSIVALLLSAVLAKSPVIASLFASNIGWLNLAQAVNGTGGVSSLPCNSFAVGDMEDPKVVDATSWFAQALESSSTNDSADIGIAVTELMIDRTTPFPHASDRLQARGGLGSLLLGCESWQNGQPGLALRIWQTGGMKLAEYFLGMATSASFQTNAEREYALLERAVQIAPDSFRYRYEFGSWLVNHDHIVQALTLYEDSYRDDLMAHAILTVDQSLAALEAGGLMIKQSQYQQAFDLLSSLLEYGNWRTPADLAWVYHQRARAAMPLQLETQAFADLAHAVELDPSNVEHIIVWGQLLTRSGRENDAIAQFDQAIQRSTAPEQTIASIALRLIWEGKYALAVDYYDRLGAPETVEVQGWKGFALARLGDTAQAEPLLASSTLSGAGQPEWYEALAEIYLQQERISEAKEVYLRLLRVAPDNPIAHRFLQGNQ